MSADRWTICPKCAEKRYPDPNTRRFEAEQDAEDYGTRNTMREDYEIWMNPNGVLTINYSCSCFVCEFTFKRRVVIDTNNLKETI